MTTSSYRRGLLALVTAAGLGLAFTSPARAAAPVQRPTPERLEDLISRLGADRYPDREKAQEELMKYGDLYFDDVTRACVRRYAGNTDVEVEVRLRAVMYKLVDRFLLEKNKGFLGIRLSQGMTNGPDGGPLPCIEVNYVFPGSAADRAGFELNDKVLQFGNIKVPPRNAVEAFIRDINARQPGTRVLFKIQRGGDIIDMEAMLQERPSNLPSQNLPPTNKKEFFREWLDGQLEQLRDKQSQGK